MGVGMTKVLHVKIPVTDLQRSADWYAHQNARICRSVLGCRRSVGGPVVHQPTEDTNVAPMSTPNVDLSSPTDGLTYSSQFAFDRWPRKHWRPCGTVGL